MRDKAALDHLFEAEKHLNVAGISFDTGVDAVDPESGEGARDWELDWSLKGARLRQMVDPRLQPALFQKLKPSCTPAQQERMERCIKEVKAKGGAVNPWAVCTASIGCRRGVRLFANTYKITKGQQYDRGGALVNWGRLYARYSADGTFDGGDPPSVVHRKEIEAAVKRVIETGQPETLEYGRLSPEEVARIKSEIRETEIHLEKMKRMMDSGSSVYDLQQRSFGRIDWMPRLKKWRVIWYKGKVDVPSGDYNTREEAAEALQSLIQRRQHSRMSSSLLEYLINGAAQAAGATAAATLVSRVMGGGLAVTSPEAFIRVVDDRKPVAAPALASLVHNPKTVEGDQAEVDLGTLLVEIDAILKTPGKMGEVNPQTFQVVREGS